MGGGGAAGRRGARARGGVFCVGQPRAVDYRYASPTVSHAGFHSALFAAKALVVVSLCRAAAHSSWQVLSLHVACGILRMPGVLAFVGAQTCTHLLVSAAFVAAAELLWSTQQFSLLPDLADWIRQCSTGVAAGTALTCRCGSR